MIDDPRASLRRGDKLLRQGKVSEAIVIYQAIAQHYEDCGFLLKAIAVSQQIIELVENSAPKLVEHRLIATSRRARLHSLLGLESINYLQAIN
jgi:hypothetical protein